MVFGDLDDPESKISRFLANKEAEPFEPEHGTRPSVKYVGMPKPVLRGSVIFGDTDDCAKEVSVTLSGADGSALETRTDFFGDFIFNGLGKGKYSARFDVQGYQSLTTEFDMSADEHYLGEVVLSKA